METMTLTIQVPRNVGIILEEKAKTDGKELIEYVEEIITKQADKPTFRELFADADTAQTDSLKQQIFNQFRLFLRDGFVSDDELPVAQLALIILFAVI